MRTLISKPAFWLFLIAFAQSFWVHQANRQAIIDSGRSLREGVTVMTSDDAAYLVPAENALKDRGWRTNDPGVAALVRSPGYGLLYFGLRTALPPAAALWALFLLQVIIFALAASLVPSLGERMGLERPLAVVAGLAVAVLPTFSGFLSYTLTEAVVPSLVIVFLWLIYKRSSPGLMIASALLGFLILVRVPMAIWLISLGLVFFYQVRNSWVKKTMRLAAVCTFIAVLPFAAWQVHGSRIAGELPGLHPIYHWDSNDLYRPIHREIWGFHKMWGQSGADFHRGMQVLWDAAVADVGAETRAMPGDSAAVNFVMGQLPAKIQAAIPGSTLRSAYADYLKVLKRQVPYHAAGEAMPREPTYFEAELADRFEEFAMAYTLAEPFHALVVVPADVYFSQMSAHSNLSLFMFQASYRGFWAIEFLRYLSFALHCGVMLAFPLACIFAGRRKELLVIALPVAVYLAYLAFVQRGVEERYTLPVLVPAMLVVVAVLQSFIRRFSERGGKQPDFSKFEV